MVRLWASGVRSETIPGSRLTTPVRVWDGQQLHQQLAESQRLALQFFPLTLPRLKVGRGPGTESPVAAKPPRLLLLTKYRLIVTRSWAGTSIVAGSRCAARLRTLRKRDSFASTANAGIVRVAPPTKRSSSSTLSERKRRRCNSKDFLR